MFEPGTPAAERAVRAASQLAEVAGATQLLLALLADEDGTPAAALRNLGVDISALRERLASEPPGSPLAEVLAAARQLAKSTSGEPTYNSEHLLRAALQARADLGIALPTLPTLNFDEPLDLDSESGEEQTTPAAVSSAWDMGASRALDAATNRAREALRVLEDVCRFAWDDAILCAELKAIRHELAQSLRDVPAEWLLKARETQHDVGTRLSTVSETRREGLAGVVTANAKRLQEALRSVEELLKLHDAASGAAVEQLRYRAYTLERALHLGRLARGRLDGVRLYLLVSESTCPQGLAVTISEAVAGGVQVVQLREKGLTDRELLARAKRVRQWTQEAGALLIVNDRPDIAKLVGADGVHLGQDDMPVKDARQIVGPDMLIGVSTHEPAQIRQAVLDGADYLGIGPTFPSRTKGFASLAGLDFIRQASRETILPTFAIGGIDTHNVRQVREAGAKRVAVGAAICLADAPRLAAAQLRASLE